MLLKQKTKLKKSYQGIIFGLRNFWVTLFNLRQISGACVLKVFVMLLSLPFAWMHLLTVSFIDFSKSILYSLGFNSNFYFYCSGQVYGAESGLPKLFLHTFIY